MPPCLNDCSCCSTTTSRTSSSDARRTATHLAHIARWKDDGRVVIAGAVGDPPHGGVLALRVDGPEAVEEFVTADPYSQAGLVKEWRVEPWTVVT